MRIPRHMSMACLLGLAWCVVTSATWAAPAGRVVYVTRFNGEVLAEEGRIILDCADGIARLHTERTGTPIEGTPIESSAIDYVGRKTHQTAELRNGSRCSVETDFSELPKLELTDEHATIQGHDCLRAKTVVRSNQIDVWFTRELTLRGTPALNLVVEDGLVLKVVRNGNYVIEAEVIGPAVLESEVAAPEVIDPDGAAPGGIGSTRKKPGDAAATKRSLLPADWGELVDLPTYRARVTESYVTTVPIFDREQISFGNEIANPPDSDDRAVFRYAGGTVIARRVLLPEMADDAAVFAEITQYSNGDAYDRTGSVFLIPVDRRVSFLDGLRQGVAALPTLTDRAGRTYQGVIASDEYAPPIELVRFITPFGVRQYNLQVTVHGIAWEDSAVYKMEITDLLPLLRGEVWIGAFIGNYDKGGHRLSLDLRYHPGSREVSTTPPKRHWAAPLFCTLNLMEMAGQQYSRLFEQDTLRVAFELPAEVTNCRLRYITTGHGGWDLGDEFLRKVNEIRIDGKVVGRFVPWRGDCETYRRLNPASGNFWNGQSSADFSRSGWCPGAAVNPMTLPLAGLAPGRHLIEVAIDMGRPAGESTSAWNVSGLLLGDYATEK